MTQKLSGELSLEAFDGVVDALRVIVEHSPPRLTIRQAMVFCIIAQASAASRPITMSGIMDEMFPGAIVVSKSILKSYTIFLEATPSEPDALGWVSLEADPADKRRKLLNLTPLGRELASKIVKASDQDAI